MVKYECEICNYITFRKYDYTKHLKTKKHLSNYNKYEAEGNKSLKKTTKRPF